MYDNSKPQWTMTVTIYHGPRFGHAVEAVTETKGRPDWSTHDSLGTWTGVGIPEEIYQQIMTGVDAIVSQHLTVRYGVSPRLDWEDEVGPF